MKHFNVMVIKLNSPSQIFCIQNNVFLEMACFKCHSLKISILEIFPENFTQNLFRSQYVGQDPSEIHQNDWLISNTFKETREKCYMHWRAQKKNQVLLPSLKMGGCQNTWQWAAREPCEQAWTMVERKIFSGKYMESNNSGNKR